MAAMRQPTRMIFSRPILSLIQPKNTKNGVPISSETATIIYASKQVDLERDRQEKQGIKLSRVPHYALAGRGTEQRQQHILVVRRFEEGIDKRPSGPLALLFHLRPDRRLVQLQANVDGEDQEEERDQERHAPAPLGKGLGIEQIKPAGADNEEGEEEAKRGRCLNPARGVAAFAGARVLGDVCRRAAVFAAERQALQEAQRHQQNGRRPADARHLTDERQSLGPEGRQQADSKGCQTHDKDGDEEGVLASHQIADASENHRPEGANEKAGRIGREGRKQGGGIVAWGKNSAAKNGAKVA